MITAFDDYRDLLYRVQDPNRQDRVINLPVDEPLYHIDLDTRTVEAPEFLSVEYDHNSETIYFCVDRFYDNIDLATMFCVIQYQNANPEVKKGGYIYPVPYFDITTKAEENKMLFQWALEGPATAYAGTVTFSIKFYKISAITVDHIDGTSEQLRVYDYVLNTLPKESKVLHGLDVLATTENYYIESYEIERIYQEIEKVRRTNDLYWIMLKDFDAETPVLSAEAYPENTVNKNNIISDIITT